MKNFLFKVIISNIILIYKIKKIAFGEKHSHHSVIRISCEFTFVGNYISLSFCHQRLNKTRLYLDLVTLVLDPFYVKDWVYGH